MNWYCRFEDRLLGPLTAAQLKALAEHGEIDDRWQVRREIDEQWRPATQVRGLSIRAAGANVDYFALLDTWSAELAAGVVPPEAVAGIPQTPPPAVAKPAESVPVDAATAAAAPPDIGPVAPDVVNRPAELSPPPELPPLPDLGLPTPPPAAASRSKLPPPLPRRAGPPPLPVRSTAPTGTAAPIPPAVPPPPAAVPSRPLSIAILGYAVLAIGFIALFSPAIAMIPAVESLSIERGVPNGLLVACGTVGGIAALVGGLGLLAGAGWSRRLLEALLVVELVCCLVVLPIGWFVATLVAAIVPLVLFYREPARAYFDRLSTAEPPEVPGWAFVGRWGLAGLNGALVIAAGVLRITHTPTPAEPTVAVRESRAEASSSSLPESGAPSGAPAVVGLPPKQPEQSKAEFTSFVFKRRNGNDVNEERPAVDPDSDQKPESADDLGEEYRAAAPVHGRLIGIEIMEGSASRPLHAVRPIFLTGDQETTGSSPAKWLGSSRTFKAKPGYAVGGMKATRGKARDGFCLTFMRIDGDRLNASDRYDSEWLGRRSDTPEVQSDGGSAAIGIIGRIDDDQSLLGMGLLFESDSAPQRRVISTDRIEFSRKDHPIFSWSSETALEGTDKTRIVGGHGGIDSDYGFFLAARGYLTGFEFGLGERFGREVVTSIRPIGMCRGTKIYGERQGEERSRLVLVEAAPGRLVSAIRVYGRDTVDGVCVIFSDNRDGDAADMEFVSESPIVGHADDRYAVVLSGHGRTVIGLRGTQKDGRNTGLGLQFGSTIENRVVSARKGPEPPYRHDISPLGSHAETLPWRGQTRYFGGIGVPDSHEIRSYGRRLIGFDFIIGSHGGAEVIDRATPLWDVNIVPRHVSKLGPGERRIEVRAKHGYAVSGARLYGTHRLEGIHLTFSGINGQWLDTTDSYDGPMVGRLDEKNFTHFNCDQIPICEVEQLRIVGRGLFGMRFHAEYTTDRKPPKIVAKQRPFEESAPAGGLLVGFEVGLVKNAFDGERSVAWLRPIFRAGEVETNGRRRGADREDEVVVHKVPDGCAVCAVKVGGAKQLNGLSLHYLPVAGGFPQYQRFRESAWIGESRTQGQLLKSDPGAFVYGFRALETENGIEKLSLLFSPKQPPQAAATAGRTLTPPPNPPSSRSASSTVPPRYPKFEEATPFREAVPPGTWLVGFEATLSSAEAGAFVTSIRAIFRKDDVETKGERRGIAGPHVVEVKSPPGYAVGGLLAGGGVTRDGFSLRMMEIVGDHLDPKVAMISSPIGRAPGARADSIGIGVPVRAIFGRTNERGEFVGLGLDFGAVVMAKPDPSDDGPEVVSWSGDSQFTRKVGGYGSGISAGTAEGPILGVEFGLVEWFGRDVIGAVHAYGEKNEFGGPNKDWNWERKLRIDAKPGYVLTGIRIYGESNADGAKLQFSRLEQGRPNLADSYESESVGELDEGHVVLLSAGTRQVHGIYAAQFEGRVVGMMLRLAPRTDDVAPPPQTAPPPMKQSPQEVEAAHGGKSESATKGDGRTRVVDGSGRDQGLNLSTYLQRPLLGFEFGLSNQDGKEVICGYRSIAADSSNEPAHFSGWHGKPGVRRVRVRARPGYAVSAARLYGYEAVDGVRLTFSRIVENGLDIHDGYNAEPVGTFDDSRFIQLTGRGKKITGFSVAMEGGRLWGFGLHFEGPKK